MLDARSIARRFFIFREHPYLSVIFWQARPLRSYLRLFCSLYQQVLSFSVSPDVLISLWVRKYMQVKDSESKKPTGSFYYLLAAPITILLFQESMAIASLFIVAIADPLCSLAGMQWGKTKILARVSRDACLLCGIPPTLVRFYLPCPCSTYNRNRRHPDRTLHPEVA